MKIQVRVTPNSKTAEVIEVSENELRVRVDAPAKENKANIRLLEILSDYYKVPFTALEFVSGVKSKNKVINVNR